MRMKYMGESFDIHKGWVETSLPTHEKEDAQREDGHRESPSSVTGCHAQHLQDAVGEKMSEAAQNFHQAPDMVARRGTSRGVIRYCVDHGGALPQPARMFSRVAQEAD